MAETIAIPLIFNILPLVHPVQNSMSYCTWVSSLNKPASIVQFPLYSTASEKVGNGKLHHCALHTG